MHIRFTSDFDWSPRYGVTIAYNAGMELNVTTPCAEAALKAGKAERLPTPTKDEAEAWRSAQEPAA